MTYLYINPSIHPSVRPSICSTFLTKLQLRVPWLLPCLGCNGAQFLKSMYVGLFACLPSDLSDFLNLPTVAVSGCSLSLDPHLRTSNQQDQTSLIRVT